MVKLFVFTINNYLEEDFPDFTEHMMQALVYCEQEGEQGTPHIQGAVAFVDDKQKRQAEKILNKQRRMWIDRCYDWKKACGYIIDDEKKTNTNFPVTYGDWENVIDDEPSAQGHRTDVVHFIKRIKEGASDRQLIEQMPIEFARFPRLRADVRSALAQGEWEEPVFPVHIPLPDMISAKIGQDILTMLIIPTPDPAIKRRHLWIWGIADIGKTFITQTGLRGKKVFMAGATKKYRFEGHTNEKIIIFDDINPGRAELINATNTWLIPCEKSGGSRYTRNYWNIGETRTLIVLANKGIPDDQAIEARFIVIHLFRQQ